MMQAGKTDQANAKGAVVLETRESLRGPLGAISALRTVCAVQTVAILSRPVREGERPCSLFGALLT